MRRPVDGDIRALQGRGWTPRPELSLFKARAGDWTWVMFRVMSIKDGVVPRTSNSNYDFNRCLCTLQDTGLLTTALGKRATASHHWLPLAYLPARSESAPVLDYEDNLAVDEIASGTI